MTIGNATISLAEPIFDTFQGEYPLLGAPVKIVRFQGCNLGSTCPLDCDTKYSWKIKSNLTIRVKDIKPRSSNQSLMITGGEPFMQVDAMIKLISYWADNFDNKIIIETNGTLINETILRRLYVLGGDNIFISISPKTPKSFTNIFNSDIPIASFHKQISFKLVLGDDWPPLNWATYLVKAIESNHPIYLMPEGTTQKQLIHNMKHVEHFGRLLKDNYRLSPRMHIFLGIK